VALLEALYGRDQPALVYNGRLNFLLGFGKVSQEDQKPGQSGQPGVCITRSDCFTRNRKRFAVVAARQFKIGAKRVQGSVVGGKWRFDRLDSGLDVRFRSVHQPFPEEFGQVEARVTHVEFKMKDAGAHTSQMQV
jgi:hypothetical protein